MKTSERLISHLETDASGRWYSKDQLEVLIQLVVGECIATCETVAAGAQVQKGSTFLTDEGRQLYSGVWGGAKNCASAIMHNFETKGIQYEVAGYWQGKFSDDGGATLYEVPQESYFGKQYPNIPLYTKIDNR